MANSKPFVFCLLFLFVLIAPAAAQSRYVGAALVGDISRFTSAELPDAFGLSDFDISLDGEALGVGISAGTAIGEHWGIEIELVRPARIERTIKQSFPIAIPTPSPIPIPIPLPPLELELVSSQRHTTITASAWVRQEIGDRFEIAYLAGVTFSRTEVEQSVNIPVFRTLLPTPLPSIDLVEHGAGPAIGVELRWKLGDHVAIVPGMKLHSVTVTNTSGWLLRPAVGARWRF